MDTLSPVIQAILERHLKKAIHEAAEEISSIAEIQIATKESPPLKSSPKITTPEDPRMRVIRRELRHLGGDPSMKGFTPLAYSLLLCCDNPELSLSLKRELYPVVSKNCHVAMKSIAQLLGGAISKIYDNMDKTKANEIFGASIQKTSWAPKVSTFLGSMTDYIKENSIL